MVIRISGEESDGWQQQQQQQPFTWFCGVSQFVIVDFIHQPADSVNDEQAVLILGLRQLDLADRTETEQSKAKRRHASSKTRDITENMMQV